MIAIIDYGAGNLRSVQKAFEFIGFDAFITSDPKVILSSAAVVLPGVGAFSDAIKSLISRGLDDVVREVIAKDKPFLGICLGQQLLFQSSEEGDIVNNASKPNVAGLGIFEGKVIRFPKQQGFKVPHMGWDSCRFTRDDRMFNGIETDTYVYFVHSYYVKAQERELVLATCDYGVNCDVVIGRGNVYGTQFHPEKSGPAGLKFLKNFTALI